MDQLRGVWESLAPRATIFQRFDWNHRAACIFGSREAPFIVVAESDSGVALIPACIDSAHKRISLLGEELFDYRDILSEGDESNARAAWEPVLELADANGYDLRFHSLRGGDPEEWFGLKKKCFTAAPHLLSADTAEFHHPRLGLNLRRLERKGAQLATRTGSDENFLRRLYSLKAQEAGSLFADPLRIEMLIAMACSAATTCEVYALEEGSVLIAALVTFRDGNWRRFYTTYYNESWARYSPGLTLLHEVVRQSLDGGLDCDFMTGDQPYKRRLATSSTPLYRIHATSGELRGMLAQSSAQVA